MNFNTNGERQKDANNKKACEHFDRLLAQCRNPSQTLTNIAFSMKKTEVV